MERSIAIAFLAMFSLTAIQCKSEKKESGSTVELKSTDKKDVDEIIKFNNNFVKLSTGRASFLRSLDRYLVDAERKVKGEDLSILIKPMYLSAAIFKSDVAPDAVGAVKADLDKNLKIVNEKFETIKSNVDEIEQYLKAEDFKDDNGAKLTDLKSKILQDKSAYETAYASLVSQLTPVSMAAEEEILKDHPLKKQILSSRKNLDLVEKMVTELSAQYDANKYDHAKTEAIYNELDKTAKENAALTIDGANKTYGRKKSAFDRFNKELENFLGATRKFMRDSQAKNAFDDEAFHDIESPYKSVVSSYNSFVD